MPKRLYTLLLAAVLLCVFTRGAAGEGIPAPAGDFNGDGHCTAADAAALLRALHTDAAPGGPLFELGDLTKNGAVTGTDAAVILWLATGQIPDLVAFVERISTSLCGEENFTRFRYDGISDDHAGNYRSENVSVSVSSGEYGRSVYYLADIYLQDIRCFGTAFGGGAYNGGTGVATQMTEENNGIIAVNGDYYSIHLQGPIVRDGVTYVKRVSTNFDTAVLTMGGELKTFPYRSLNKELLASLNPWQTWVFGPRLLDETGKAMESFRSNVTNANPRTVLGYYAPGHYSFVVVDGRQSGYSVGMDMQELSQFCESLGFAAAYNLDGGQSSEMVTPYGVVNHPTKNGRPVSDIVVIREIAE